MSVDVRTCVCVSGYMCVTMCASVHYVCEVLGGRHVAEQPLPESASLSLGEGIVNGPPWGRSARRYNIHLPASWELMF